MRSRSVLLVMSGIIVALVFMSQLNKAVASGDTWSVDSYQLNGAVRTFLVSLGSVQRSVLVDHTEGIGEYEASLSNSEDEEEVLYIYDSGNPEQIELSVDGAQALFVEVVPGDGTLQCMVDPVLLEGVEHLVTAAAYDRYLHDQGETTEAIRDAILQILSQGSCL